MLLILDSYEEFSGMPVSICALPWEVCVGGGDRWHEALTKLFQTDNVGRKWTSACLGCCVLSAVPQIYFTFVGYNDYVKSISGWCPERTVCPYDCCFFFFFSFLVEGCFLLFCCCFFVSFFLSSARGKSKDVSGLLYVVKWSVHTLILFFQVKLSQDWYKTLLSSFPPFSWSKGVTLFWSAC